MEYTSDDKHYIKGFEDGCDYIVREIERWSKEHNLYMADLLYHLKGKPNENFIHNNKDGN